MCDLHFPRYGFCTVRVFTSHHNLEAMKIRNIVGSLGLAFITLSASAQVVSKDSINLLKNQKEALELSKKLNDRKLELAKLENELQSKTEEAAKTAEAAQRSVEQNRKAADRLSDDPQDKRAAKRASKSASSANRDAKKARRAADSLEKLKRNIEDLKKDISRDEEKLASLPGTSGM